MPNSELALARRPPRPPSYNVPHPPGAFEAGAFALPRVFAGAAAVPRRPRADTLGRKSTRSDNDTMLSVMEVILSLKATPLFQDVPGEGLRRLSDFIHEKRVEADELIFAEQDLGDEMYLVRGGRVDIMHNIDGEPALLETVEPGGYFGEMAIIDDRPRSATAIARESTSLLVLHKSDFRAAVLDYPDIAFEVFREFTRRLRAADARYRKLVKESRRLRT